MFNILTRATRKNIVSSCCSCCFRFNFNRDLYVQFSWISLCKLTACRKEKPNEILRIRRVYRARRVCTVQGSSSSLFVVILTDFVLSCFFFFFFSWPNTKWVRAKKKQPRQRPENIYPEKRKRKIHEAAGKIYDKMRYKTTNSSGRRKSTMKYIYT